VLAEHPDPHAVEYQHPRAGLVHGVLEAVTLGDARKRERVPDVQVNEPKEDTGDEEGEPPAEVCGREPLAVNRPVDVTRQQLVRVVAEHVDPEVHPEQYREPTGPHRDGTKLAERALVV